MLAASQRRIKQKKSKAENKVESMCEEEREREGK